VKRIALTQGKFATVDDEDYTRLNAYRWFAYKKVRKNRTAWYAARNYSEGNGKYRMLKMHREILGVTNSKTQVDHKNGDGLDNQKANLRLATNTQNCQNQNKIPRCTSKLKGVYWNKKSNKWQAQIRVSGHRQYLGLFVDESAAGDAYDSAAQQSFGKFALTNKNSHRCRQ